MPVMQTSSAFVLQYLIWHLQERRKKNIVRLNIRLKNIYQKVDAKRVHYWHMWLFWDLLMPFGCAWSTCCPAVTWKNCGSSNFLLWLPLAHTRLDPSSTGEKHLKFFVLLLQADNSASTGPPVLSLFSYAVSLSSLTSNSIWNKIAEINTYWELICFKDDT